MDQKTQKSNRPVLSSAKGSAYTPLVRLMSEKQGKHTVTTRPTNDYHSYS